MNKSSAAVLAENAAYLVEIFSRAGLSGGNPSRHELVVSVKSIKPIIDLLEIRLLQRRLVH